MYISIHIPKTAGTSLSIIFDYGCNRRIWYDYSELKVLQTDLQANAEQQAKKQQLLAPHKMFLVENFEFIHGHFYYSKYRNFFEQAKFITCLRNPIDRLVSHYYHLLDEADENYWLFNELSSGQMDIVDLASIEGIGNIHSKYLMGKDIMDYDFVFLSEKLPESIYHFQLLHEFQRNDEYMNLPGPQSIPRKNIQGSKHTKREVISDKLLCKATSLLKEDNELYQRGVEKFIMQGKLANKLI